MKASHIVHTGECLGIAALRIKLITQSLNVARLAHVPDSVLYLAAIKSKELEAVAGEKNLGYL